MNKRLTRQERLLIWWDIITYAKKDPKFQKRVNEMLFKATKRQMLNKN